LVFKRIVTPACPPMTGTFTLFSLTPFFCATNVLARTTSNVVTPNTVLGSYAFYFFGLENLCSNWNSGVHWIADDIDKCVGAMVSNSFNKTSHDASVDVEQIISGHSGFTGHSSWDNHKVDTLQCRS
jgi:hypothetical protein